MYSRDVTKSSKRRTRGDSSGNADTSTVGYASFLFRPRVRPNCKIPLSAHTAAGRLLKEVLAASNFRKRIYNLVDKVRCTLDDWAGREYTKEELPSEEFFKLYYRGQLTQRLKGYISQTDRERNIANLRKVQEIVVTYYPDCIPRQDLLETLDNAITLLEDLILPLEPRIFRL